MESTKTQIVILLDSLEEIENLENLDWLSVKLLENIKIIVTVNITKGNKIYTELQNKIKITENFVTITKFSQEQWNDVLSFGGGDIYAANGALQLPEAWKNADEKKPIQAKVTNFI